MTPAAILAEAAADGLTVTVSPSGGLRVRGDPEAVERWQPALLDAKAELLAALAANDGARAAELRALVRTVGAHYAFTPDEFELATELALADPVAALRSYRIIAAERGLT